MARMERMKGEVCRMERMQDGKDEKGGKGGKGEGPSLTEGRRMKELPSKSKDGKDGV